MPKFTIFKAEDDFVSEAPRWLNLKETSLLPTESGEEIKSTIIDAGTANEHLEIQCGSVAKTIKPPGGTFRLKLALGKTNYSYTITVQFRDKQWWCRRFCYLKVKTPMDALHFFDENTNGIYNEYEIDGVALPGSRRIIKLEREFYLGKGRHAGKYFLNLNESGTKLTISRIPIKGATKYIETLVCLNRIRMEAGLNPLELNEQACNVCQLHIEYLVPNNLLKEPYEEDLNKFGFTKEGAKIAPHGIYAWKCPDIESIFDEWMSGFARRVPLLHPGIRSLGMALHDKGKSSSIDFIMVDLVSDCDKDMEHDPIAYPYDEQVDVPRVFVNETPDPLPPNAPKTTGYPITLQFAKSLKLGVSDVVATLKNVKQDKEVACYLSTPSKPALINYEQNLFTICLIPKEPLQPKTRYTVTIRCVVDWKKFAKEWFFTTE